MEKLEFTVEKWSEDRIDKYLDKELIDYTRSFLQKIIKSGDVLVNGNPVKANYKLSLKRHQ